MVSGFQCLDNVITVGNYGNRGNYVDINGNTYTDATVTPGEIALNSSWGPTRDGRIKPDVAAPGGLMLSCGQLSLLTIWATQPGNAPKIAQGGFHFRDGGTSSSSPVVAGIAALYLQQNPTATAMQVKNAIIQCAVQDNFTGNNLPDVIWGHGKADAFNTLVNCSLTSVAEHSADDELPLYPNPVMSGKSFTLPNQFNEKIKVEIGNSLGEIILQLEIEKNNTLQIGTRGWPAGVYYVKVLGLNGKHHTGRLVVTE
jgi:subtilisin family serine protease